MPRTSSGCSGGGLRTREVLILPVPQKASWRPQKTTSGFHRNQKCLSNSRRPLKCRRHHAAFPSLRTPPTRLRICCWGFQLAPPQGVVPWEMYRLPSLAMPLLQTMTAVCPLGERALKIIGCPLIHLFEAPPRNVVVSLSKERCLQRYIPYCGLLTDQLTSPNLFCLNR